MSSAITRRDVLKGTAALGLASLTLSARSAGLLQPGSMRVAYFSDTHVSLGRNIAECRAMLVELKAFGPRLAVNGGDVTDYGWEAEFVEYDKLVAEFGVPTLHVPGNHDVRWSPLGPKVFRDHLRDTFGEHDLGIAHLFQLDSTVPLSHWGHYESSQLRWLESRLRELGREKPVVVTTHHWVGRDRVMIDNEESLYRVLEPYNVKLILTGHGHSDLLWDWGGFKATMNRGLHQGSYQILEFDANEVRLGRRSEESKQLVPIASVPMRPDQAKAPVWAFPTVLNAGESAAPGLEGVAAYRWNDAATYSEYTPAGAPTGELIAGTHQLALQGADARARASFEVLIRKPGTLLSAAWELKLSGGVMSHVELVEGRLYVSAMDGSVTCVDAQDGQPLWTAKTDGFCHSTPCVQDDLVVVGSADGKVYGIERTSGRRRWEVLGEGPFYASAAFAQGVFGIAGGDGHFYGISPSGALVWRTPMPPSNTAFCQSRARTDGERFFFGAWDSHLYCVTATNGQIRWRRDCQASTFAFSPAIGSPAVAENRVIVPANGNGLFCFDATRGDERWMVSSPGEKYGHSGPAIAADRVVAGCLGDKGQVRCVDFASGRELWMVETGSVIYDSTPVVAGGLAAIGSVNGTVSLIDIGQGSLVGQYRLPAGHLLSTPAIDDAAVYAASYSDTLTKLRFD